MLCAQCGGPATLQCARCIERGVTEPACYCSCACQAAAWPEHRAWHREQRQAQQHGTADERRAELEGIEYRQLVAAGFQESREHGNHKRALKLMRKATALAPDDPTAFTGAGVVCHIACDYVAAAQYFTRAMELSAPGTVAWAGNASHTVKMLALKDCAAVPKPAWWTDEGLLSLTERIVAAATEEGASDDSPLEDALEVRAAALYPDWYAPATVPRTYEMLREAARCWQHAATLTPYPDTKRERVAVAVDCNRLALEFRTSVQQQTEPPAPPDKPTEAQAP